MFNQALLYLTFMLLVYLKLSKAYEELNKRIHEHDEHGHIKGEITLQVFYMY